MARMQNCSCSYLSIQGIPFYFEWIDRIVVCHYFQKIHAELGYITLVKPDSFYRSESNNVIIRLRSKRLYREIILGYDQRSHLTIRHWRKTSRIVVKHQTTPLDRHCWDCHESIIFRFTNLDRTYWSISQKIIEICEELLLMYLSYLTNDDHIYIRMIFLFAVTAILYTVFSSPGFGFYICILLLTHIFV